MNTKYKWWIIGGVSLLVLATLTSAIIIRKRRKSVKEAMKEAMNEFKHSF